jgi:tRNA(Ile2) C34 agmatinyltransferase TiaS
MPYTFRKISTTWDWCPFCGGSLDTGWECNECGADLRDHAYPRWQRLRDRLLKFLGIRRR